MAFNIYAFYAFEVMHTLIQQILALSSCPVCWGFNNAAYFEKDKSQRAEVP